MLFGPDHAISRKLFGTSWHVICATWRCCHEGGRRLVLGVAVRPSAREPLSLPSQHLPAPIACSTQADWKSGDVWCIILPSYQSLSVMAKLAVNLVWALSSPLRRRPTPMRAVNTTRQLFPSRLSLNPFVWLSIRKFPQDHDGEWNRRTFLDVMIVRRGRKSGRSGHEQTQKVEKELS